MAILDGLDHRLDVIGAAVGARNPASSDLAGSSGGGRPDWGALLGGGAGGRADFRDLAADNGRPTNWTQLLGGGGARANFAGLLPDQNDSPLISGQMGHTKTPNDYLAQLQQYRYERDKQAADDEAAGKSSTMGNVLVERAPLDGVGVQGWLRQQAPNSPLVAAAPELVDYAQQKGVDPALLFGLLQKESASGSDNGQGTQRNNPGNIMAPGADPAHGVIKLEAYPTMVAGARAMVDTLAGYQQAYGAMFGRQLTATDMVAIYYVGPEAYKKYGLNANDAGGQGPGGNGTVSDYVARYVQPTQAAFQQFQKPTAATSGAKGGGTGYTAAWGGGDKPVTQEFGPTDFSQGNSIYDYGADYGVSGHTGVDVGLARGSKLYSPVAGTVLKAGGTGYFKDEDYGDPGDQAGRGELKIQLDNGDQIILGHTSAINVKVGQRVNPGDFVGLSGSANGDHLHYEVRVRDSSLSSGYRIVDPRKYFATHSGGGGGGGNGQFTP